MQIGSSCSGRCEDCITYYSVGTCLAGHGDDDFSPINKADARNIFVRAHKVLIDRADDKDFESKIFGKKSYLLSIKLILGRYPDLADWWNNPIADKEVHGDYVI